MDTVFSPPRRAFVGTSEADVSDFVDALCAPQSFLELLELVNDGVYLVDRRRTIRSWNRACERLTGYAASEVVGRRCFDNILRHVDDAGEPLCVGRCPLAATMRDGNPREARVWLHHKLGHRVPIRVRANPIKNRDGRIIGALETFSEESALSALHERIEELEQCALVDSLTGVPNRRYLELTLSSRLAELGRHGCPFMVVYADIDHFKEINDRYGHEVGDQVLQMIASTLAGNLRGSDTLARAGGEEFVLLLYHSDPRSSLATCRRLRTLVASSSLTVGEAEVGATISFGATLARPDDTSASLLRRADALLYESKRAGRDRVTTDLR